MGGETEYAIGATSDGHSPVLQPTLLSAFMDFARASLPYTSVSSNGRFLANGGLIYLDSGLHIEWASPECASAHDVVRYLRAGDRVVQHLAEQFEEQSPLVSEVYCSRCNVDYLDQTLWASHESYRHICPPATIPRQLVPFLVSRVVMCGAGGWDFRSPGLSFTLSPRACFITEVMADNTQYVRPIFHTKNERLSHTGSHRLHVGCSETLCSDLATFLRFGTTALVMAAIDDGATPGDGVWLASPLTALRQLVADPGRRVLAAGPDRRRLTAVEIQRHYLAVVERHLGGSDMPAWAEPLVALWRRVLDDLDASRSTVATSLDWAIKRRLFAAVLARRGIDWAWLPVMNASIRQMTMELAGSGQRLTGDMVRRDKRPVVPPAQRWRRPWEAADITRDKLAGFLDVREQLLELDMRFGQLGPRGVFDSLDRAGVLTHRVPGIDGIETAMDTPPQGTRATVRGEVVRRLTAEGTRYRAEWTQVVDIDRGRVLDLGDPFEAEERWSFLNEPARGHHAVGTGLAGPFSEWRHATQTSS